jgi:hypothetical protein
MATASGAVKRGLRLQRSHTMAAAAANTTHTRDNTNAQRTRPVGGSLNKKFIAAPAEQRRTP